MNIFPPGQFPAEPAAGAGQILEPYVDLENKNPGANPFSYALAGRIYCCLGHQRPSPLMVGRANVEGRCWKIAAVPMELREAA